MNKPIVVNLMGAPCAGKSTLAALVFSKLKMENINCEIVTEFAKDLVWNDALNGLNNQLYVFSEQFYRVWRLKDKVDVIITDSPMILSIFYNRRQKAEDMLPDELFAPLVLNLNKDYNNMNYFLKRSHKYEQKGRKHTEQESSAIESGLIKMLDGFGIKYKEIYSGENTANEIVKDVKSALAKSVNPEFTR